MAAGPAPAAGGPPSSASAAPPVALEGRVAKEPVLVGTITYPTGDDGVAESGWIVIGRAVLEVGGRGPASR